MAITKKIIGRVPVCFGTWYSKVGGWGKKNRVTMYGSEFESLHDGNITPPAVYDDVAHTVAFNTNDWMIISNGTAAWLADAKINDLGTWTTNAEYIRAYTDENGKLLFGIRTDGSVEWSKGVPAPIRKEIEKLLNKIDGDIEHEIEDLETSVNNRFEALEQMLEETYGTVIENDEFIRAYVDTDNKFLFGIRADGSVEWSKGIPAPIRKEIEKMKEQILSMIDVYVESEEYIHTIFDGEDKFLFGIRKDGSIEWSKGVPAPVREYTDKCMQNLYDYIDKHAGGYDVVSSPEYIYAVTDADGKFIFGVTVEGEFVTWKSRNGNPASPSDVSDFFKFQEDYEERTEMTLDKDGKILSYRKKDGVKVENVGIEAPNIKTSNLNLTPVGMTEFQQALKNAGFNPGGTGDWSDYLSQDGDYPLSISIPRCAMLNINHNMNLSNLNKKGRSGALSGVNYDVPAEVEFFDMQGNYFKKNVLMSGQGQSSMNYNKKNIALDFFDKDVNGGDGDAFAVKFGNWVAQDSFHIKAYVADFFKGLSVISYQIAEEVAKTRGIMNDTPWKRALWGNIDFNGSIYASEQIDDISLQMDNGARCQPDGFPVIVYHNGEFYGVYVWTLKKHRDNYHMSKSNAKNIHVDGEYYTHKLFDGDIDWTSFEPRNPKDLYYKEAHLNTETGKNTYKYDADNPGQFEIADQTTVNAWINAGQLPDGTEITSKIQKNLQNTAKVHKAITDLSGRLAEIEAASTVTDKKELIETYFDVPSLIDYELINCAVADPDSIFNNVQWITYDGTKWYACEYDKDDSFGNHHYGNMPRTEGSWTQALWSNNEVIDKSPIGLVRKYYQAEAKARWQELVSAGIFTTSHFMELIINWMGRIGAEYYAKEYEKWPDSISDRDSNIDTDNWKYVTNELDSSVPRYSASTSYSIGDRCSVDGGFGYSHIFEAIQATTGNPPTTGALGWRGSIGQIYTFIENNFEKENAFFSSL